MTEEAEAQPVKRGPGRPRKNPQPKVEAKQAPKVQHKMRAAPNWATVDPNEQDAPDRLHIDRSLIPDGMDLLWVTSEVFGQADHQHRAEFERKGWTPVHQEDFDGRFDGMFMKRGDPMEITVRGLVLMARPLELSRKAKERDKRMAREQVAIKEAALRYGDIPIPLDARHPSAVNSNRINKSFERIEVPEE
jgi:hypothetical protein